MLLIKTEKLLSATGEIYNNTYGYIRRYSKIFRQRSSKNFMNIHKVLKFLDKQILNPSLGLPEEVFFFISRLTPLVNVDLLIKEENGRTLLAWRDDQFTGKGWYVPGGIIRFKETMKERLEKVAETEIGAKVEFEPNPIAVNEIILKRETRGHFISFLFKGCLQSSFIPKNKGLKETDAGYLKWHKSCPDNLLKTHKIYEAYINDVS